MTLHVLINGQSLWNIQFTSQIYQWFEIIVLNPIPVKLDTGFMNKDETVNAILKCLCREFKSASMTSNESKTMNTIMILFASLNHSVYLQGLRTKEEVKIKEILQPETSILLHFILLKLTLVIMCQLKRY